MAWGSEGHQVVALIAQSQLTPKARGEVDRLLKVEPGATLASISTWADEHRNPSTAPWHYVNFPRETCVYEQARDCPAGKCVVGAIERQSKVLASTGSDEERLVALKYVVHFVGDVHQPLHAGYLDDKGGNTHQLQAFMRGTNLHALWDTAIIRNFDEDPVTLAQRLSSLAQSQVKSGWTAIEAAQESCMIVGMPGYYPKRQVGMDYVDKFKPTLERRLIQAGARLAKTLNDTWR